VVFGFEIVFGEKRTFSSAHELKLPLDK